jgi:hypothetical protein
MAASSLLRALIISPIGMVIAFVAAVASLIGTIVRWKSLKESRLALVP